MKKTIIEFDTFRSVASSSRPQNIRNKAATTLQKSQVLHENYKDKSPVYKITKGINNITQIFSTKTCHMVNFCITGRIQLNINTRKHKTGTKNR